MQYTIKNTNDLFFVVVTTTKRSLYRFLFTSVVARTIYRSPGVSGTKRKIPGRFVLPSYQFVTTTYRYALKRAKNKLYSESDDS